MHKPIGRIGMLDGRGADTALLGDGVLLQTIMVKACEKAGANVRQMALERFEPQGVCVVLVLAESHASLHSYPEHGVYFADVFTCGDVRPDEAVMYIAERIGGDVVITYKDRAPEGVRV